jgi:acetolactate synthase-1/2/3 large subunit
VGIHQMKGAQWLPASEPRSLITSGGMGSMGCALPMAFGAHFAHPEVTTLAFCGDGGFVMSSHELDTIGGYALPIKLVVFDDSSLGMVGNWHGLYFGDRRLTSDRRRGRGRGAVDLAALQEQLGAAVAAAESADDLAGALAQATAQLAGAEWPLFAATAAGYGIPAERVHTKAEYAAALRRALETPGPYLVQVVLPAVHGVFPLMEPGTTPQEIIWRETVPGSGVRVPAGEHFDYETKRLRAAHPDGEHPAHAADLTAM